MGSHQWSLLDLLDHFSTDSLSLSLGSEGDVFKEVVGKVFLYTFLIFMCCCCLACCADSDRKYLYSDGYYDYYIYRSARYSNDSYRRRSSGTHVDTAIATTSFR